jgi:hypothetical protein
MKIGAFLFEQNWYEKPIKKIRRKTPRDCV